MDKRLVRVEWLDAQDHADKWVDEADAEAFNDVDVTVVSVGFLVRQGPKYLTLAADWDSVDRDYGRVTKIPASMVVSILDLHSERHLSPDPVVEK